MENRLLQDYLQDYFPGIKIYGQERIFGGDINMAASLKTNSGQFFIKWNDNSRFPGMFEAEFKGLTLLKSHSPTIRIPKPLHVGKINGISFLLMEFINDGQGKSNFWKNFAEGLSSLHKNSQKNFGLDHNNYIGSLPQSNTLHKKFEDFFISERLEPQVKLAYDRYLVGSAEKNEISQIYRRYAVDVPRETASLIHGDLWSGNYMTDNQGNACIFDPAVYYGHRESDLAMTKLFGSFSPEFYTYYHEFYPLEKGWENRADLFNLYPLLVHLNLFGKSYLSSVMRIVKKYL
jgi:fructosamine-3-kinase